MKPLVSIVCPAYNRAALLGECVNSVLDCQEIAIEFIIVDDGSNDDTPAVCKNLQQELQEVVKVVRWETNEGAQVARNRGFAMATGDFVMFLDSDDVVVSEQLVQAARLLRENAELDFVYGKTLRVDQDLVPIPGAPSIGSKFSPSPIDIAGYHWAIMAALYRRTFLQAIGPWNERLSGSQDWEFQARVKIAGGRGLFLDAVVGLAREHHGSRVGTRNFRPDYVRSVMVASEAILKKARARRVCDEKLERRIAKRLVLHALEWGSNGCRLERKECMWQAYECMTTLQPLKLVVAFFQILPPALDGLIFRALRKA
ncbi:MAG TPA: glycosyltransferase family 2 protein [Clostridia bacterium]|nr:glycosyltransferase family 2 protein [Clostridia bacterium]